MTYLKHSQYAVAIAIFHLGVNTIFKIQNISRVVYTIRLPVTQSRVCIIYIRHLGVLATFLLAISKDRHPDSHPVMIQTLGSVPFLSTHLCSGYCLVDLWNLQLRILSALSVLQNQFLCMHSTPTRGLPHKVILAQLQASLILFMWLHQVSDSTEHIHILKCLHFIYRYPNPYTR